MLMSNISERRGDPENRYRDDRGREHYDNGRYAPMRSERYTYGDPRGEMRSDHGWQHNYDHMDNGRGIRNNGFDITWDGRGTYRGEYQEDGNTRRLIGFGGAEMHVDSPWHGDEMGNRVSSREQGYASSDAIPPLTPAAAEAWMSKLQNEDGTRGPHWTLDQVRQLLQQKGIQTDPLQIWVAINAEYSDMVKIYRKYNMDRPEVYLDAALARWINDKDAVDDKLAAYYRYIVKH